MLWIVANVEWKHEMSFTVNSNIWENLSIEFQQMFYNLNKLKKLHDYIIGVDWVENKVIRFGVYLV